MEILVYKRKKKLQAELKTTGITPHEPTEIENLLDTITALEESAVKQQAVKNFNRAGLRRKMFE